jgi:hypothetical protein
MNDEPIIYMIAESADGARIALTLARLAHAPADRPVVLTLPAGHDCLDLLAAEAQQEQQRESEAISERLTRALDVPLDFGAWELAAPQPTTGYREPTHARRGGKVSDKRSRKAQKAARRKNR